MLLQNSSLTEPPAQQFLFPTLGLRTKTSNGSVRVVRNVKVQLTPRRAPTTRPRHHALLSLLYLLPDGHCQQRINYLATVMTSRRRRDALWGRQSAGELEEEALGRGNDAVTFTTSEILQGRLLGAERRARGAEAPFCTRQ